MAKEFKDWVDEFVDNGADAKDVTNWPEEAGGGGTTVVANPELVGDEPDLTGLEVDGAKYKVPQGRGSMEIVTLNYVPDGQPHSITQEQVTKLQNGAILIDDNENVYSLVGMNDNRSMLFYQFIMINDILQIEEVDGIAVNIDMLLYQCIEVGQPK